MTLRQAQADAARLQNIRASLAAIEPGRWTLAADDEGMFVEAASPMGELLPMARFHPGATSEEMIFVSEAPENIRFLLGLVDRAVRAMRAGREPAPPPADQAPVGKDYAAEAAMKCQEPAFKKFLEEKHGLERPLTDERAAQRLRGLLGVTSRRELNQSAAAAERWQRLRDEFQAWRRAG